MKERKDESLPLHGRLVAASSRRIAALRDWGALHRRQFLLELAIVLLLTTAAAVPRLVLLGDIPLGIHGDEAAAGLEARQILHGVRVEAYSRVALGVPSGTFYWTALIFKLLGDGVWTLRFAFALLGIASVPVAYLAFRVMFGRNVAIFAALFLSFSSWHLHYSRIAMIPISLPLFEVATLLFFFLGLRTRSRLLFALAGVALGAGIYGYQAWVSFAVGFGMVVIVVAPLQFRRDFARYVACIAVMVGVAGLVGLPMASFARKHPDIYLGRYRAYSVTRTSEYQARHTWWSRAEYLGTREREYLHSLVSKGRTDGVDAAGVVPFIDPLTLVLLAAGAVISLWRSRHPPYMALIVLTITIGSGPVFANEGSFRRTIGLTPLLAVVAALPLALLWEHRARFRVPLAAAAGAILTVGAVGTVQLSRYYRTFGDDEGVRWVYNANMTEASRYMATLPRGTYVYFLDNRATLNFEVRQFLSPNTTGEDRSKEFTKKGLVDLSVDRSGDVAFIFMGAYLDDLPVVQQMYVGGDTFIKQEGGDTMFASYRLSRAQIGSEIPTPAVAPTNGPEPTSALDQQAAAKQDDQRRRDLLVVMDLLQRYHAAHGSYPVTVNIQSLCKYPSDAGCALREFSDSLPEDPSPDGVYSYQSAGQQFFLFADFAEATSSASCAAPKPEHFAGAKHLFCLPGAPEPGQTP